MAQKASTHQSDASGTPPFHQMDAKTRTKLEELRQQTPRYLFRAWKASVGGYQTLNSTQAIVPLAFRAGRGHASVYDMTKQELRDMVLKHLDHKTTDFLTELSSWTASLSFAMLFYGSNPEDVYISIIDTHALRAHNDIFFVPGMSFLKPKSKIKQMHHEYLAHGPIRGNGHCAVPLEAFYQAGYSLDSLSLPSLKCKKQPPKPITSNDIQMARSVGKQYDYSFATPITLALLCLEARSKSLFLRDGSSDMEMVVEAIEGLEGPHIFEKWGIDPTIMDDVVYTGNYRDIRQLIDLMRAVVYYKIRYDGGRKSVVTVNHDNGSNGKSEAKKFVLKLTNKRAGDYKVLKPAPSKNAKKRIIVRLASKRSS